MFPYSLHLLLISLEFHCIGGNPPPFPLFFSLLHTHTHAHTHTHTNNCSQMRETVYLINQKLHLR